MRMTTEVFLGLIRFWGTFWLAVIRQQPANWPVMYWRCDVDHMTPKPSTLPLSCGALFVAFQRVIGDVYSAPHFFQFEMCGEAINESDGFA